MTAQASFSAAGHFAHESQTSAADGSPDEPKSKPPVLLSSTATATSTPSADDSAGISLPPPPTPTLSLHYHRQSHNSSKLPAFRFTDFKPLLSSSATLSQPSLAHHAHHNHAPPSPVSPNPAPNGSGSPSADRLPVADKGQVQDQVQVSDSVRQTPDVGPESPTQGPAQPPATTNHDGKQADSASPSEPAPAPAPASAPAFASAPVAPLTSTTTTASPVSPPPSRPRSRASTQPLSPTTVPVDHPTQLTRAATFPDRPPSGDLDQSPHPDSAAAATRPRPRPSLVSRRSDGAAAATVPPISLNSLRQQLLPVEVIQSVPPSAEKSSKDSPTGQRELILPKTLANSSSPTDEKRSSLSNRPPVSYRPPISASSPTSSATPVRVPPIRSFRSSGSRKSIVLDMNARSRIYDMGDDTTESSHDRTLRALEGRFDQDYSQRTPTSARHDAHDNDDTGDVFLKIAREESNRRMANDSIPSETQSVVSRVKRSSHRRPLSSTVPSYKPTSPPQIPRRLSDQQNTSRSRPYDDDRMTEIARVSSYRTSTREKAASVHPGEDLGRARSSVSALRPSPLTSRSMALQENGAESSLHSRRRSSVTDSNSTIQARPYKPTTYYGQTKAYNSSPLVRSFDFHSQTAAEPAHGPEGTESTGSTTAPSTVWDELDDLKSRIHRLELTGKLPSTSGAAMSRISDERPPTATTTVTTMSSSPKRPGGAAQSREAPSTVSGQRETHPLLQAALSKSKPFIDAEVFRALESAATEAMALSLMMGSPGLPGPISSGASTIGVGTTLTDRQLRRKADSVCRSLTELCVALGEEVAKLKAPQAPQAPKVPQAAPVEQTTAQPHVPQSETPTTPTVNKAFAGLASQRRQSIPTDQSLVKSTATSPRTISKLEERRINLLSSSTLPSPRVTTSTPSTPLDANPHRRSSLLLARTRRAVTEEPEEGAGRRSSLLLRTRRAGTEEPDEGRKTSLLVRNRRGTVGEDDEEAVRFRTPTRAQTDLNSMRASTQTLEQPPQQQASDANTSTPSTLPRRRFLSSTFNPSRLATPSMSNLTPARRYLERSTQEREGNNIPEKHPEERTQRYVSLGQTLIPNRSGSLSRRPNRDSTYTTSSAAATAGGYR